MRILHLDDETWDSGLTEYALSLALEQLRQSHEVLFAAPAQSHAFSNAGRGGLQTLNLSGKWSDTGRLMSAIRRFRPEIINAHTGSAHSFGALTKLLSGRLRPALVRTRADARLFRRKPLSGPLWALTDGFIGANTALLNSFRACYPANPPSRLITQGIADLKTWTDSAQTREYTTLGMLSRLDPVKGHSTAIKAMRLITERFPKARLRIAGQEQNIKKAGLEMLVKENKLTGAVSVEGFVEDKAAFLRGCDIGLVPSTGSEAVSRAALEWLCAGKPVLASSVGGLPDLIKNGENGRLLPPCDERALAEAVCELLSRPDKILEMSANARAAYQRSFTLEKFAAETYDFYKDVLKART